MSKTFSQDEVAKHNKATDLYIVVDEDVYDLTAFQDEHPGMSAPNPCPSSIFPPTASCKIPLWTSSILIIPLLRWKEDPHASRRQGRLETVLEVPQ